MNENASGGDRLDDPWLTVGEIAQELRVNPATVRLWVSKGQLPATRAGMRKWIVRRSDLDRMLESGTSALDRVSDSEVVERSAAPGSGGAGPAQKDQPTLPTAGAEPVLQLAKLADRRLNEALRASASASSSAGSCDRLRAIADGFEHVASTTFHAGQTTNTTWAGGVDWGPDYLPYEVRPAGNRPMREGLWDGFDSAYGALRTAAAGTDILAVAQAFRDAGDQLLAVADRLADDDIQQTDSTVG